MPVRKKKSATKQETSRPLSGGVMGTTTRELNTLLQRHGLFPDKHAVTLLKNHVEKSKDPKGDVASIVARIKGNPACV